MRILKIIRGNEIDDVKALGETVDSGLTERGAAVETAVLFPGVGTRAKLEGALRVAWRILTGRYDAVIAYQASSSIIACTAAFLARCRHRIAHQAQPPRELRGPPRWLDGIAGTLGIYTVNIANSQIILDAFSRYPARYRDCMRMIEYGVAVSRSRRARSTTLTRFAIPDDGTVVLTTAGLEAQRNHVVLVRALSHEPSARLLIPGDGPMRDEYIATAHALGVLSRVHLLGDINPKDMSDLLAAADVFAVPSTVEAFGLTAIEAAAAGLPLIASDLPILREVLSVGAETVGHFVSPLDPLAWARAIAAGPPVSPARSREIARVLTQRYSPLRMIDAYAAVLDLPKQSKAARPAGTTASAETSPSAAAVAQKRSLRRRVAKTRRRPDKSQRRASNE